MDDLSPHAQALEDAFFSADDPRLSESLHELKLLSETTGLLSEVTGIVDADLLARLAEMGVTPATATGLALVPLVVLAWADGRAEEAERRSIVEGLEHILFFHTIHRDIVEVWLSQRPPETLFDAWEAYACRVVSGLTERQIDALGAEIVRRAKAVASAAGRVLGLGGATRAEKAFLERVEGAFAACH